MDRSIPIFNRVVVEKLQRKHLDLHHKRLEKIKVRRVQMQANPTRRQTHSVFKVENLKGSQIEEERRTEIEKNNVILFNKMNRIMNRSQTRAGWSLSHNRQNRLRQQNDRIYEENKAIVQRIGNQRPTISTKKLYEDRMKRERLLRFMGKYPYRTANNLTREDFPQGYYEPGSQQYEPEGEMYDEPSDRRSPKDSATKPRTASNAISRPYPPSRESQLPRNHLHQSRESNEQSEQLPRPAKQSEQSQHRIPLYKKRKQINQSLCTVEVNRLYNEYEFKLTNLMSKKEYQFIMSERQGNQLLSDNDYDYNYLASCFRVVGNKLVLDLTTPRQQTQQRTLEPELKKEAEQIKQSNALLNDNKLRNYRLKEAHTENEVGKADLRNVTESNPSQPYGFEDLGTFHHSDTLEPAHAAAPAQPKIFYEQALDQQLQEG